MDDLMRDFLTESAENLARLDNDIVALEQTPEDGTLLKSIFRTIHTIKGTCGFLDLNRLEAVAHAAENVLDCLRAGTLPVQPELIGDVLAAVDSIKVILAHLERTEQEPAGDDSKVIARLARWTAVAGSWTAVAHVENAPREVLATPVPPPVEDEGSEGAEAGAPGPGAEAATEGRLSITESSLRVNVVVLDQLMNLVGELALGRNQLIQLAAAHDESEFAKPIQHLNRVTSDLLETVMKTRMQPIGNAWTKLPRLVRDLADASGKKIALAMKGSDTELDRQILQAIQDPLMHMIRNSADHGVEDPATRVAAGKGEAGTIQLNARHEGGHVIIEISDDGAGISPDRIRRKAVERGLLKAEAADAMPDAQVLRYIFEPGFSTAEKITNVSGRGVGMDVVRSNIELIGGTVEISSHEGRGTTVRVKIPLTLAIISALLVGTGGDTFAVPQIGVVELVHVTEEQRHLVENVHGAQFYRLRDVLLPLVFLNRLLGLPETRAQETYNIVVCQVGETTFGLVVEEVFDTQDIVVKPVGRLVKHLQAYAGCTITGDGRVIMILDTAGIENMAHIGASGGREDAAEAERLSKALARDNDRQSILLFDSGFPAPQAVPLSRVARLEEFAAATLEEADGQYLVQYRGSLIPVIGVNSALEMTARDPRPVIVIRDRERTMGVAVNEIMDIVEDSLTLQRQASRPGVLGVCVIAGRATEVLDTDYFLRLAHGEPLDNVLPLGQDAPEEGMEVAA